VINDLLTVASLDCRGGLLGFRRWSLLLLYLTDLERVDLLLTEGPTISLV
jgi:hypothetical protein